MDNPQSILSQIANRRVLVIGDTIVDVNTYCERAHDLDDGTPVYRTMLNDRMQGDRHSLGGAALVVRNLLELGAKVDFLTTIGYGSGAMQAANLHHPNLTLHAIQVAKVQTVKHRLWCEGRKVLQFDQVSNADLPVQEADWLHQRFDSIMDRADKPEVIVIADYRHGLISDQLAAHFVAPAPTPQVLVSSQVSQQAPNHDWYAGASGFVLNRTEAEAILPQRDQYDADYVEELRKGLNASFVVVTCGAEGCLSADELVGGSRTLPVITAVDVVDDCGAGDAFLAAYAVTGMLSFANVWAGLSCTVPGANPPRKDMLNGHESGLERDVLGTNRNGQGTPGGDETHHHARGNTLFS